MRSGSLRRRADQECQETNSDCDRTFFASILRQATRVIEGGLGLRIEHFYPVENKRWTAPSD